ncbi:BppU family phage baseplate upper protein [Fructobacillus evanidus]|uniref:BppU N-terminal domain-containing protein n=1 Tax=Fructobacillus evanidus TaxID=3064281 RepID=A0ABN9YLK7_9LACO|nr:hypothetical protein R55250_KEHBDPNM_00193 [Fructobacillus sp. LMG 32999]CAK1222278.1 hypothetical protein R53718_MFFEMHAI_00195 [Fructobacillus sp. LMG 32999]CAK1225438.1 hypothetical protein R54837_OMAIDLJD_00100 [Fructobacillus sp. LMG 32999]CAK1225658.1 hypothetical protein R53534_HOPDCFKK_00102 [Fructobacillus sp. LMG 32999]CAK1225829.1 hypothetical protein R55203_MFJFHIJN_00112 [Fructobacillus sp. LMG 32999]
MSKTINLNLDTSKSDIQNPKILLRQGDGNYQTLRVTITSNGEPTDLTNADVVYLGTTSADHKIIDSNITKVDALNGVIDYRPPKQWGQDMGNFKNSYFEITTGDSTGSTASFKVSVLEAVDLNAEQAGDYITVVDGIVAVVRKELSDQLADVQVKTDNATGLVKQASDNLVAMAQNYNTDITNKYNDANAKASNINQLLNTGVIHAKADTAGTADIANSLPPSFAQLIKGLEVTDYLTAKKMLYVDQDATINRMEMTGQAVLAGKTYTSDLQVNGPLEINSTTTANKNFVVQGHAWLNGSVDLYNTLNWGSLTVKGSTNLGGDTVTNKLDVNGPLFAHQDVTIFGQLKTTGGQNIYTTSGSLPQYNITYEANRVNNLVIVTLNGHLAHWPSWNGVGPTLPNGFRPIRNSTLWLRIDYDILDIIVGTDGSFYNRSSNRDAGISPSDALGTVLFATNDSFPW